MSFGWGGNYKEPTFHILCSYLQQLHIFSSYSMSSFPLDEGVDNLPSPATATSTPTPSGTSQGGVGEMVPFVPPLSQLPPTLTITQAACKLLSALKASVVKFKCCSPYAENIYAAEILHSAYCNALGLHMHADTIAVLIKAKKMVAPGGVPLSPPALQKVIDDAVNELEAYAIAAPPDATY